MDLACLEDDESFTEFVASRMGNDRFRRYDEFDSLSLLELFGLS